MAASSVEADLAFRSHDHAACAGDVQSRVAQISAERNLRLTQVRQRVLEILLEAQRAVAAHEILDQLAAEEFGSQPPVAYRALDYLAERGLVHRISRHNAFAACLAPDHAHNPVFLICESGDQVHEMTGFNVAAVLSETASALGFRLTCATIEALGICPDCQKAEARGP